jgi:uncharacterized glyoxalase superfamily protein PhnB
MACLKDGSAGPSPTPSGDIFAEIFYQGDVGPGDTGASLCLQAVIQKEIFMAANPQTKSPEAKSQPAKMPQVKGGAVPYLTVNGAVKAADFYKKAFAAEVASIQPPDEKGRTMHAHVYINGGSVMMSDAYPEHGHPLREPAGFNVTLPVSDVDTWYERAIKAGCSPLMPPSDMFWGDRYAQLKDPFGVLWALVGPIKK